MYDKEVIPLETVKLPLVSTVKPATVDAALESKPEVMVTNPDMVGITVQEVGPTVNDNPFNVVAAPALPMVKPVWFEVPMSRVPVTSQRELAAPVRFRAPAEVMVKVPEVAVDKVRLLFVTVKEEIAPEAKVRAPADELPIDIEPVEEPVLIKVL